MSTTDNTLKSNSSTRLSSPTRLRGRKLQLVRIVWAIILLLVLVLGLTAIPVEYEAITQGQDTTRSEVEALLVAGVAPEVVAIYDISLSVVVLVVFVGVGVFLYWRSADAWLVIFLSMTLILMGFNFGSLYAAQLTPGIRIFDTLPGFLSLALGTLGVAFDYIALYWFPDGRFVPRWTAWLVAVAVVAMTAVIFLLPFPDSNNFAKFFISLPINIIGVASQIYRYRTQLTAVERQQAKWLLLGILLVFVCSTVAGAFRFLLQIDPYLPTVLIVLPRLITVAGLLVVPFCIGIAILRYGVWQVDLTLNRSLVYAIVTVIMTVTFLGVGFLLHFVLGEANSGFAFAISIVSAMLLFQPARKRVQHIIDRRFYRFRFDLNELAAAQINPEIKNAGQLTGKILGGYRLLGVLGKGGMGEVYQGDGERGKVAIKILPDTLSGDSAFRRRFEREAQMLADLDHHGIVKTFSYGENEGVYYMALEYIDGQELGKVIKEKETFSPSEADTFIGRFAEAVDYAHQKGLVHRDIKPSNIMLRGVSSAIDPVLMDFGIAKLQDARTELTGSGAIGTIDYMAPEQIVAAKDVDHRADIYALGAVMYEMLTGERVFKGSAGQVLFAHLQQPPTDPRATKPNLPDNVAEAILKALAKDPADRFQSAGEFAAALHVSR